MRVISITGGVGSGKSQVLKLLEQEFGALVLFADEIAHQLMEPGEEGYRRVIEALGDSFLGLDGRIDRSKLAALIFKDQSALKTMNSMIHPLVWEKIREIVRQSHKELIIVEAALFDGQPGDLFDEVWYIYTSKENRIIRLMESRGYSKEKCLDIMSNQPDDAAFRKHSDYVIDNNQTIEETRKQIKELWKRITATCD